MSALAQLELVKWYFTPFRGRMKSYYDVYAVTFFPAMIGKPENWVLQTRSLSASTVAAQNRVIAKGKSRITVADFKAYAIGLVPKSVREQVFGAVKQVGQQITEEAAEVKELARSHPQESAEIGAGTLIAFGVIGWYIFKKD